MASAAIKRRLGTIEQAIEQDEHQSCGVAYQLLVQLLARRDALFWPWRTHGGHRAVIKERQRDYLAGRVGLSAKADGQSNWKEMQEARRTLLEQQQATANFSGGQVTSLFLTPQGEADARALVGSRLCTVADAKQLIDRLRTVEGDTPLGANWVSEGLLFEVELDGDPEQWQALTEYVLPLLAAGIVEANSDVQGRVFYKLAPEADIPETPTSKLAAADEFDAVYLAAFDAELRALQQLTTTGGGVVIPIPCSR